MSDLLMQRLHAANPVRPSVVRELEARVRDQVLVLPLAAPDRKRRWVRPRPIIVACVLAALLGGPALAFQLGVIDFATAPSAPARVVEEFSSLSQGAPPGMDPQVRAGQTRLVGSLSGHQLWVSPTEPGGFCYEWSDSDGGCDSAGGWPLGVTWSDAAITPADSTHTFAVVDGFARARWVDQVQITLGDGSTAQPEMIWVSPPISAGFFYYQAPAGQRIASVSALRDGTAVAADSGHVEGAHPFADLSKKVAVASIQTEAGPATLWTAPTETDERCTWLQFGQQEIRVAPCLPRAYVHQAALSFAVHSLGGHRILAGECGYGEIQFLHTDETTRTVACNDGLVFVDLQPADAAGSLRAVNAQGQPLPGSTTSISGAAAQP